MAVTEGIGFERGRKEAGLKIDFLDARRASYHAYATREVYIQLPEGDRTQGMCGKLIKSLQGTRDAAQN